MPDPDATLAEAAHRASREGLTYTARLDPDGTVAVRRVDAAGVVTELRFGNVHEALGFLDAEAASPRHPDRKAAVEWLKRAHGNLEEAVQALGEAAARWPLQEKWLVGHLVMDVSLVMQVIVALVKEHEASPD